MRQVQSQRRASNFSESEANAPQALLDVQETMRTKQFSRLDADELRREYDLAALGAGVSGEVLRAGVGRHKRRSAGPGCRDFIPDE